MLKYENIHAVSEAQDRLRGGGYRWQHTHTKEADALLLFTCETKAIEDAEHNLQSLLALGCRHGATHLILHANKVQFLSHSTDNGIEQELITPEWKQAYLEWTGHSNIEFTIEDSGQGVCHSFRPWRRAFATRSTHGIYDLSTGQRIKNRQEIIERIWAHGFAAWRGRPLSVAAIRWAGTKEELEDLTAIADRYWKRRFKSDMAKKMCSAYTSINRYCAWPGAW